MAVPEHTKNDIRETVRRARNANLNTSVVREVCCFIDGLGRTLWGRRQGNQSRFKKYIETYMPTTFALLKQRSRSLGKNDDYCLNALWSLRNNLVHEVHPDDKKARIIGKGKTSVHLTVNDKRYPGLDLVLSSPKFIDDFLDSLNKI